MLLHTEAGREEHVFDSHGSLVLCYRLSTWLGIIGFGNGEKLNLMHHGCRGGEDLILLYRLYLIMDRYSIHSFMQESGFGYMCLRLVRCIVHVE